MTNNKAIANFYKTSKNQKRAWYVSLEGQLVYTDWKTAESYLQTNYGMTEFIFEPIRILK